SARQGGHGGSGSFAQAVPPARAGTGHAHHQANEPHHDHRRRGSAGRRSERVTTRSPPRAREGGYVVGQKTNPIGMRLGIIANWDSRWFARKDYAKLLEEDIFIRRYLKKRLAQAGISRIIIQRAVAKVTINISTARPGLVI